MAVTTKYEIDLTGLAFTDELHANVGSSAFQLDHHWFWGGADLNIYTATGGGGTKLTEGVDYTLSLEDTYLTAQSGKTVYGKVQVTNVTYQTGNLYFNGEYIGDSIMAADINDLQTQITALGGGANQITLGSQTMDDGLVAGDAVFRNLTRETVDGCVALTWTDDAEIVTSVNSTTFKLSAALNLTKTTGSNVLASVTQDSIAVSQDFTDKSLNIWLYIADQATLDYFKVTDCLEIRYGSGSGDFHTWTRDVADLAVGWNYISGLTAANADSETGTVDDENCDYAYLGITTLLSTDTWAEGKVIMDYWYLSSEDEWQISGTGLTTPQGIYVGSSTVVMKGYTDQLAGLIPSLAYWMGTDGKPTPVVAEAYNQTYLFFSKSDTEAIVDIHVNRDEVIISNMTSVGYAFGGARGGAGSDETTEYVPDTWTDRTTMPNLNWAGGTAIISGKIYAMYGNDGAAENDVFEYSPDTWSTMGDGMAPTRYQCAGFQTGNKGYVSGGITNLADHDELTPPSSWVNRTNISPGRQLTRAFNLADDGYVLGGYQGASVWTDECDLYNQVGDGWTVKNNMGFSREGGGAAGVLNKGYYGGGYQTASPSNNFQEYDPDTWTTKSVLLAASYLHAFLSTQNRLFQIGRNTPTADIEEYLIPGDSWTSMNDFASTINNVGVGSL